LKTLVAQVEAFRLHSALAGESTNEVKRTRNKAAKAELELDQARSQLYEVLTQNLQLVERVREPESQLLKNMPSRLVREG
jgi:hypothetical protein